MDSSQHNFPEIPPQTTSAYSLESSRPNFAIQNSLVPMDLLRDSQSPSFPPAVFSPLIESQSPPSRSSSASSLCSRRGFTASPGVQDDSLIRRPSEYRPKVGSSGVHEETVERAKGDNTTPSCGFARRLYRLLEDPSLSHILCWGPGGDFFVIKDIDAFTTTVLPRSFKHSNFASFVRQLNKYDFHKIKAGDDIQFGDHSWLFRHHDFRAGGVDMLDNIKRKVTGSRRLAVSTPPPPQPTTVTALEGMQTQVVQMVQRQGELTKYAQYMRPECTSVVGVLAKLQQTSDEQDETLRQLVQFALGHEDSGTTT